MNSKYNFGVLVLVFVLVLVLVFGPGLGLGLGPKISGVCVENVAAILSVVVAILSFVAAILCKTNLVKHFCPSFIFWTCVLCVCLGKPFNG